MTRPTLPVQVRWATCAAMVLVLVVAGTLLANTGTSSSLFEGTILAYLLSALVLACTIRPLEEIRRVAGLLLGTGTAWMAIWWVIGFLIGRIAEDAGAYAMADVFTLCALGAGTLFGLVAYAKPALVRREWAGTLVGVGAAVITLIVFIGLQILLGASFPHDAMVQSTNFASVFTIPAAVTGAVWASAIRPREAKASSYGWIGIASLVITAGALAVEIWVGWMDAHEFTLRPAGHLGFLVLLAWAVAFLCGVLALIITRRRPYLALLSLGICTGAVAWLFTG
jgi:hypothetical protein